jgi:hypothetical protein
VLIPACPEDEWRVREDAGTDHAVDHEAGDVEAGQALRRGLLLLAGFEILPVVGFDILLMAGFDSLLLAGFDSLLLVGFDIFRVGSGGGGAGGAGGAGRCVGVRSDAAGRLASQ